VHRVDLRDHFIVVWSAQGHGYYRCIVVSVLSDGPGGAYTLDVTERDFHALRDVSPNQLVELAHRYLSDVPMLPLDPRQQESWGRWGNNGKRGVLACARQAKGRRRERERSGAEGDSGPSFGGGALPGP